MLLPCQRRSLHAQSAGSANEFWFLCRTLIGSACKILVRSHLPPAGPLLSLGPLGHRLCYGHSLGALRNGTSWLTVAGF